MVVNAELSRPWLVREERLGRRVIVVGIAGDVFGFELDEDPQGRGCAGDADSRRGVV
jgi:hypothetical protein